MRLATFVRSVLLAPAILLSLSSDVPAQPPPASAPVNELDAFMEKVLARRAVNRRTMDEYVLDEVERFHILGPGRMPLHRTRAADVHAVPHVPGVLPAVRFNGVAVGEDARQRYEVGWMARERALRERREEADATGSREPAGERAQGHAGAAVEPRFVSEAYFLEFRFEPGNYYLAGQERLDGHDVLRVEYIRGYRVDAFDGDRMVIGSAELRLPITSVLNGARFGVTAFFDAGKVWDHGRPMREVRWHRGAGGGIFLVASIVRLNLEVARGLDAGRTRVHSRPDSPSDGDTRRAALRLPHGPDVAFRCLRSAAGSLYGAYNPVTMPLPTGTRLGEYDVLSRLGAGGMGEVYRARDTKLGRDVALKVLPESFAGDAERVARFRREAQLLAGLQHPHIAGIYGVQDIDGCHLLVLELVDGGTLADRIRNGPLPVDEALAIAREIALALEAAHERGVVHRDLKPSNIALTTDGTVKVLDFGLARATDPASGAHPVEPGNSPTITSPLTLTALGVILGTAAYMSPEQARGAVADRRSDVWAFGCVLYEMLTGSRAFPGEDVTDTLAAVVRSQPDWSRLPASAPPAVRALLEGCLEKDRRKRIGDMAAARFALERAPALTASSGISARRQPAWRLAVLLLGVSVLAAAGTTLLMRDSPPHPPVTRFTIRLPPGQQLSLTRRAITISPDGDSILYAANGRLFLRRLSDFEAQPIAESGIQPTFSPDGQTFAFFSEGTLKRASLTGGVALPVRETAPAPYGISWSPSGILLVESARGIIRASPNGGAPSMLVPFNEREGLMQGVTLLPDGDTLLFARAAATSTSTFWDSARIVARSLRTGEERVLIEGGSNPLYVRSGHILYMVEGTLMAVAFDPARRAVVGTPAPVVAGVRRTAPAAGGEAQFAVSASGTLAYVPGPARAYQEGIFVYGNDGTVQAVQLPPGRYDHPRVSPDGQRLALEVHDGKESWIATYHLSGRTAAQRLTFGGNSRFPAWTRDGTRVVFQSDREGDSGIFWQPVTGGTAERLTKPEPGTSHIPEAWSPRADVLLFSVATGSTYSSWTYSLADRRASPFGDIETSFFPINAAFSPDGRWVAYQAGESGTGEAIVYVQPFPATGTKHQIARGGRPVWSPDGRRLFFIPAPGQFQSVSITGNGTFEFTTPESVPRPFGLAPPQAQRTFDILPDGRIIGLNTPPEREGAAPTEIHVVQNWFEELKAKVQ